MLLGDAVVAERLLQLLVDAGAGDDLVVGLEAGHAPVCDPVDFLPGHRTRLRERRTGNKKEQRKKLHSPPLMPACLMTAAQRGISRSIAAVNCAGVPVMTSRPRSVSRLRTSGSAKTRVVSRFRRSTIAAGVPAGALTPKQGNG